MLDIFNTLPDTVIDAFGINATLFPQSEPDTPVTINGIFAKPSMLEQVQPGYGVAVIRFFVRLTDTTPTPLRGDQLQIGTQLYDINEVLVDAIGGATLKLRTRGN